MFIDLRDNYGITQCIIDKENSYFKKLEKIQLETVIKIVGKVVERSKEAYESGASEVCLQGGIHPNYTGEFYLYIIHCVIP